MINGENQRSAIESLTSKNELAPTQTPKHLIFAELMVDQNGRCHPERQRPDSINDQQSLLLRQQQQQSQLQLQAKPMTTFNASNGIGSSSCGCPSAIPNSPLRSRGRQLRDFLGFRRNNSNQTSSDSACCTVANALTDSLHHKNYRSHNSETNLEPPRPATELPTRKFSYHNGKLVRNSPNSSTGSPSAAATGGSSLMSFTTDLLNDLLRRRRKSADPSFAAQSPDQSNGLVATVETNLADGKEPENKSHRCEYCNCHLNAHNGLVNQLTFSEKNSIEKSIQASTIDQLDGQATLPPLLTGNRLSIEIDRKQSCSSADSGSILSVVAADDLSGSGASLNGNPPKWAQALPDPVAAIFGPEPTNVDPIDTAQWVQVGKQMVDYIANYIQTIDQRRVTPNIEPGLCG